MTQRMSASEYRRQFIDDVEEAEIPYPVANESNSLVKRTLNSTKPKGMPQPTENQIQSSILERLGMLQGAFFWRENSGVFNVGDGDKKRFFRAGIEGIADIMGVYMGCAVAIEVKRPGRKQSLAQIAFQQKFDRCGGVYIVCTDPVQVVNQIMASVAMKKGE